MDESGSMEPPPSMSSAPSGCLPFSAATERGSGLFLAPDKEDDYVHSTEPSYWIYFAVCHGKRFGPSGQPSRVARALGYRVEPSEEQPILRRPEDILTYDPPGRGRGR